MRRTIRPMAMIVAVLAVVPLHAGPAGAGCCITSTHADADDVSGKLDLRRVGYVKQDPSSPMRVTVRTYPGWPARLLNKGSGNTLRVKLDVDPDPQADFTLTVKRVGGVLEVFVRSQDEVFESLPARHPDRRTIRFRIPGGDSSVNPSHGGLRIRAVSRFVASAECDPASGGAVCVDRAPDAGFGP